MDTKLQNLLDVFGNSWCWRWFGFSIWFFYCWLSYRKVVATNFSVVRAAVFDFFTGWRVTVAVSYSLMSTITVILAVHPCAASYKKETFLKCWWGHFRWRLPLVSNPGLITCVLLLPPQIDLWSHTCQLHDSQFGGQCVLHLFFSRARIRTGALIGLESWLSQKVPVCCFGKTNFIPYFF